MRELHKPVLFGALAALATLAVLLPELDGSGFWSEAELGIVDRSRAALGEALSGLLRSPWLPDAVRTAFYSVWRSEFGIRLPHALATAALAGFAAMLVRQRGGSTTAAVLAAAMVSSFPAVALAGRTVLGNPIGELLIVITVLTGVAAARSANTRATTVWAALAGAAWLASVSASGLVLGGAAPLFAIAVAGPEDRPRFVAPALAAAAVGAVFVAVWLSLGQDDGYIPLLGAAKDLELIDKPEGRRYAAALEDFGYQIFPWAGLVAMGAVRPKARWPALWAITTLGLAMGWSLAYGKVPVPASVPAALCAVAAVETIADVDAPRNLRRITVLVAFAGIIAMRKDADLHPSRIAASLHDFQGEHNFNDDAAGASQTLRRIGGWGLLGLLVAAALARRRDDEGGWEAVARRIPAPLRDAGAVGVVALVAMASTWTLHQQLIPTLGKMFSPKQPLERFSELAAAGAFEGGLAIHRIRDPGLALYGPGDIEVLQSRREVFTLLMAPEPRAALVRTLDVPPLHQHARLNGWDFHVLDDGHARLRLVSNTLPEGVEDLDRIPEVLVNEPPALPHETLVQFEQYIKVIGWDLDDTLVRGQKASLTLAIEVLRPLPGGSKIYTRLMRGRLSKINVEPVDFAEDLYPCNLWRAGDFIIHRYEFEVPALEILPGTYDFVIGVRRSEKKNYDITVPAEREGEFGVEIRDKKHNFAKIGEVEVW